MARGWQSSDRRSRLPADWPKRRERVFKRDGYRCTWVDVYGDRCIEAAEECDHIVPNDDHSMSNLRSLCAWHHSKKSAHEGGKANARIRAKNAKKFLRTERHPGLL